MSASSRSISPEELQQSPDPFKSIQHSYALYFFPNASKISDLSSCDASDGSAIGLNILATNLSAENETDLRCFLCKRLLHLSRESFDDSNGKIGAFHLGTRGGEAMCLFQMFSANDSTASKESATAAYYILCFVAPDDGTLELFCSEVESFGRSLSIAGAEKSLSESLRLQLEKWHETVVMSVCRVVQHLGNRVAILLHLALSGGSLNAENVKNLQVRSDLERFMNTCGLHELRRAGKKELDSNRQVIVVREDQGTNNGEQLRVVLESSEPTVPLECSADSMAWAKRLSASGNDPLTMRRIIEGYRIRTIQDMNLLKRVMKRAETDHYALFKVYRFLKASGYTKTLLKLVAAQDYADDATSTSVMSVLLEHLPQNECISGLLEAEG